MNGVSSCGKVKTIFGEKRSFMCGPAVADRMMLGGSCERTSQRQ